MLLLESCSNVTVKDQIWIGNKGDLGAVEFHTLTSGQKNYTKDEWQSILKSNPLVCTNVATFGEVKKEYEQFCSVCNCCNYDTTKAIDTFVTKVQTIKTK